jgi:hypothetical protein
VHALRFGNAAMLAIEPREIPQVASTSMTRFIGAAFIVYLFDKGLSYFPSNLNWLSTETRRNSAASPDLGNLDASASVGAGKSPNPHGS